jgi:hypothetical protein
MIIDVWCYQSVHRAIMRYQFVYLKIKQKVQCNSTKNITHFCAPILFSPTAVEAPKLLIVKKDFFAGSWGAEFLNPFF